MGVAGMIAKKIGGGAVLKTAMTAGFVVPSYMEYRKEGHGVVTSVAGSAAVFASYELLGPLAWGLMAKDAIVGGAQIANQVGRGNAKITSQSYKANFGGHYQDTSNAATMRQRGVEAIQRNGLNARSVLGSEARTYFRNGY